MRMSLAKARPAPVSQVHAAEPIATLEAVWIVRIDGDAAVGVRNGQIIDCYIFRTLDVGVIPSISMFHVSSQCHRDILT